MAGMIHLILWLAMMAVFICGVIGIVRLANKLWAVSTALGWAVLIVLMFVLAAALGAGNQLIKHLG
ncbi:hypothetical protein [Tunturiibacter gelidoferens]|jgi:hypothetical protein|uniref:Glucan phosphoethanolaminetransferase (Alkaline phosphatase superfamily) n=1 Tax=Tunturiibacter gelidiferens TaxID=3069689 RepID=A0A9X0U4L4_9BACT|nr:hypothetical protein [Edaphobacter lichenicola]MBB5329586.1 glucan phosphoethanolaminetransferase (alkaline phosphatase superfamily) [Edaphobacter lichenicola]